MLVDSFPSGLEQPLESYASASEPSEGALPATDSSLVVITQSSFAVIVAAALP